MNGDTPLAFLVVNCDLGSEKAVAKKLRSYGGSVDGIEKINVKRVYGVYDMVAEIYSSSLPDVKTGIRYIKENTENMRGTLTLFSYSELI